MPRSKIMIRKLPPLMQEEEFTDLLVDWKPKIEWICFNQGKCDPLGKKEARSSIAYVAFSDPSVILDFCNFFRSLGKFENISEEEKPQVEFAPNQNYPKEQEQFETPSPDDLENDPFYKEYLESLNSSCKEERLVQAEESKSFSKTMKTVSTPLVEFVNQKAASILQSANEKKSQKKSNESQTPSKEIKASKGSKSQKESSQKKFTPLTEEEIAKVIYVAPSKKEKKPSSSKKKSKDVAKEQKNIEKKQESAQPPKESSTPKPQITIIKRPQSATAPIQAQNSQNTILNNKALTSESSSVPKAATIPAKLTKAQKLAAKRNSLKQSENLSKEEPSKVSHANSANSLNLVTGLSASAQEFLAKSNLSPFAKEFPSQSNHSNATQSQPPSVMQSNSQSQPSSKAQLSFPIPKKTPKLPKSSLIKDFKIA